MAEPMTPLEAARNALLEGRERVAEQLREKRAEKARIAAEIRMLVAEDEGLVSALRPFERAARKSAEVGADARAAAIIARVQGDGDD